MCLAVPLRVLRMEGSFAVCVDAGGVEQPIDTLLTGPLEAGQWVLCFLGAAREVVDEARAAQVADALGALAALGDLMKVSPGGTASASAADGIEALLRAGFADLMSRDPQLPEFLRPPA